MTQELPLQDHLNFFAPKSFKAAFKLGETHYLLEVQTPDLRQAPVSMWADWGPMYAAQVSPEQRVSVVYACPATGETAGYRFSPPELKVESPALFVKRQEYPFTLEVIDAARGLRICASMDHDGEVQDVDVSPLHACLNVDALLFRDTARPIANATPDTRYSAAHAV